MPGLRMGFLRRLLPAHSVHTDTPSLGVGGAQLAGGRVGVGCCSGAQPCHALVRDGGLKREKVKDTFKEEQQKLYIPFYFVFVSFYPCTTFSVNVLLV